MRIAVFSDVHGNPYACEAVLEAIEKDGVFDAVIAAGDICFGGSDPAGCVDMLREAQVIAIYGNTDEFVVNPQMEPPYKIDDSMKEFFSSNGRWAAENMKKEQIGWLSKLGFDLRYSANDNPVDDLLIVHANPKNVYASILPPLGDQEKLFGEVTQTDDDPGLMELLQDVEAQVIAYGHFHYTSLRILGGTKLVNVSPCSLPMYDHDPRARYTIFTKNGEWQIEPRYVEYDFSKEAAALLASDLPIRKVQAKLFE